MSTSAPLAIEIRDLRVRRSRLTVLHGITLSIPRGSLVGLLGPSGGGNTTLMRCIMGIQLGVTGGVQVLGQSAGEPALRHRLGYVTQADSQYDDLTVRQNLTYFRSIVGAPRSDVDRVIDEVDLRGQADQLVSSLSGGQRSRVSLAVALLGSPELLVLDEPTVGLDPVLRAELWTLFHRLADAGTALLVSSHVMDEATRCDSLVLLREGRVLASDTLERLFAQTGTTDAEQAFLALIARDQAHPGHPHHRAGGAP
jgi:ABC-2 type transport system ATP-binding protein